MDDSLQSTTSQPTDITEPTTATDIVVTMDEEKKKKIITFLAGQSIYIPSEYLGRLEQIGLLDKLMVMARKQSIKNTSVQRMLKRYHIRIPDGFYSQMFADDLFEPLLNETRNIDSKEEILHTNHLKTLFDRDLKRQSTNDPDERSTAKKQKKN
ncbi:unnamed protein product [Adineta steineri]|uniref:Uncharacterized protein n=2 Tax=Adineta steineri TaxID=433720 RepID=A0A813SHW5_9BILA|nr:unnamed protein product [Adineta steineri]CAF0800833.1 unnamed protein product [Adineta steineri]CAF3921813.1 unnamed protein product [Adineta steineri]